MKIPRYLFLYDRMNFYAETDNGGFFRMVYWKRFAHSHFSTSVLVFPPFHESAGGFKTGAVRKQDRRFVTALCDRPAEILLPRFQIHIPLHTIFSFSTPRLLLTHFTCNPVKLSWLSHESAGRFQSRCRPAAMFSPALPG